MNVFASTLVAYHQGDRFATFSIRRNDGFQQEVPAAVFFEDREFPALEKLALDSCKGHILDIGAAAGRHSLELIRRGNQVTALDIAPEMEIILKSKGVMNVVISDIRSYQGGHFDTLLMLMNGIGMVGDLDALDRFLLHAHTLIQRGGRILCDSIDVSITTDPVHIAYREQNISGMKPLGQQTFTISSGKKTGLPFNWLHLDFTTLARHAEASGWKAELLTRETNGHYLAELIENL